jgi:hypothetical protein
MYNTTGRAQGVTSTASKIERNVTLGLAAADQQIAIGRRLDWVRPVDDGAVIRRGNRLGSDQRTPFYRAELRIGGGPQGT